MWQGMDGWMDGWMDVYSSQKEDPPPAEIGRDHFLVSNPRVPQLANCQASMHTKGRKRSRTLACRSRSEPGRGSKPYKQQPQGHPHAVQEGKGEPRRLRQCTLVQWGSPLPNASRAGGGAAGSHHRAKHSDAPTSTCDHIQTGPGTNKTKASPAETSHPAATSKLASSDTQHAEQECLFGTSFMPLYHPPFS
jgi:hypothetical protein